MAEAADVPPQVFVGDTPLPITVQRGAPVKVPIFFVGGTFANKNVELFVYRVDTEGNVVCYGPEGWETDPALDLEDLCPLGCTGMPEYIYLYWPAIEDSQCLSDCSICVCVDDQEDGVLTTTSEYCCGCQSIIIEEVEDNTTEPITPPATDPTWDPLHPVAPTFPDLTGDSSGTCNSLNFIIEGETASRSSISRSLELGESEQITLLVSACGSSATVSRAYKATGGDWLSVSSSGGKLVLNLDAGVTGLQSGSTYTGQVTVTAGGITGNMPVTLRVEGVCEATSASVSPASLTFNAYAGGSSPSAQTIRVEDNCGDSVSATVSSKPDWLTINQTATGVFSVACVSSYLDAIDTHNGRIALTVGSYGSHTVDVELNVSDTPPPPPPDDSVTSVKPGVIYYEDIPAGQARYFRFSGSVPDCLHPIQIGNTSMANQKRTVHALIKRGTKPTIAEFDMTWEMSRSDYDCTSGQWIPAKPSSAKDLFWKYNTGSAGELVEIPEPMASSTFYIMLYNNGSENVKDQRLIVTTYE